MPTAGAGQLSQTRLQDGLGVLQVTTAASFSTGDVDVHGVLLCDLKGLVLHLSGRLEERRQRRWAESRSSPLVEIVYVRFFGRRWPRISSIHHLIRHPGVLRRHTNSAGAAC